MVDAWPCFLSYGAFSRAAPALCAVQENKRVQEISGNISKAIANALV
jgi:hypothetical protein